MRRGTEEVPRKMRRIKKKHEKCPKLETTNEERGT
jgi:hypothetical protein